MSSTKLLISLGAAFASVSGVHGQMRRGFNTTATSAHGPQVNSGFMPALGSGAVMGTQSSSAVEYNLVATYDSTNFFDQFSFFTAADPTNGDVQYVSKSVAQSAGLAAYKNGQVYLGVDSTTMNPAHGRESVRLTSNTIFNQGVFILDVAHMPQNNCGVWPAFWTFGNSPGWPATGEIDIIEGVNTLTTDQMTLHTSAGCSVTAAGSASESTLLESDCNYPGNAGTGCGIVTTNKNNYGSQFNTNGGGVYAMQWASDGIYIWFYKRGNIPANMLTNSPDTTTWGTPLASFRSNTCDFSSHFQNHNIIFDTTFCGSWAGDANVWANDPTCSKLASTCKAYVDQNPSVFANSYWSINSLKVFQHV